MKDSLKMIKNNLEKKRKTFQTIDPIEKFILFEILIISNQKFQEQLECYLNLNTIKIQSWGNRIAFRAYFEFERLRGSPFLLSPKKK